MDEGLEEVERTYNILVYGIEKKGLSAPIKPIVSRNFNITFEPFDTNRRFNEYDGVILFQGIFEQFEWKSGSFQRYLSHTCATDELDKRKKEAQLLLEKGGFLCFLLNEKFIDRDDGRDFVGSDLAKHHLNFRYFYRENFTKRITHLDIKSDEFRKFLSIHGAATSYFYKHTDDIDWGILAEIQGHTVGMVMRRQQYFLPSLVPDDRAEIIEEYFTLLTEGLTASNNKLQQTLPDWVDSYSFNEETQLISERDKLETRIYAINQRIETFYGFKSILVLSGSDLVSNVCYAFSEGFGFSLDTKDELREDFKILDKDSKPICLCEVKGTNKGVKREHINQADSHRERANLDDAFPTMLIINTHIKNARSLPEKDQDIAAEQIRHAVKLNVLIVRTIDLLGLLEIYLTGHLSSQEIQELFTGKSGWLRVAGNTVNILNGNESTETSDE